MLFHKHRQQRTQALQEKEAEQELLSQAVSPEEWRRLAMAMSWTCGMFPGGYGIWYFY